MKKCKSGYYYCNTDKKCKPIPRGYRVGYGGYLRKEKDDDDSKSKSNGNGNGNGNGSNGNGNGGNGSGGNGGGGNGGGLGEEVTHEAAVIPAIAGASKFILPAAAATIGAVGTFLQARKKGKFQRKEMKGRVGENQKIKPKLLDAVRKKQREIEGNVDDKLNTPTDIVDFTGKNVDKKTLERMNKRVDQFNSYDPLQEEAPTNNVGGGQIAGTVEAGDDPPVKKGRKKKKSKKKRYIYGGTGSRRMWMKKNNK